MCGEGWTNLKLEMITYPEWEKLGQEENKPL